MGRGPRPGSLYVPYHDLHALPDELDPARPVAVDLRVRPARRGRRAACSSASALDDVIHVVDGGVRDLL